MRTQSTRPNSCGQTLLSIAEGDTVRVSPKLTNYTEYTRGLGKEMWAKLGGGDKFLREERASWE